MRIAALLLCAFMLMGAISCGGTKETKLEPQAAPDAEAEQLVAPVFSNYTIGVGDTIEVKFFRHEEFNRTVRVVSPGIEMFNLVGDVQLSGRSVFELRDDLRQRYLRYLKNPEITITVTSIQSQKITVLGEVKSPGVIMLDTNMTLADAIAMSGGATNDADTSKVVLVKRSGNKASTEVVDYKSIMSDGKLSRDKALGAGDIIFVPAYKLATASWFMQHINSIISPIVQVENGIVLYPNAREVLRTGKSASTVIVK